MTLFCITVTVLVMVGTGLILFRGLARSLCGADAPALPSERDLVLLGILPGLALVAVVATGLGIAHLLTFWMALAVVLAVFFLLHRDARAVGIGLRDGMARILAAARSGDLLAITSFFLGVAVFVLALRLCFVPAENVDVWVFHIPLAQSIVAHHGFVYPQFPNPFYANEPLLFELLFATAMLAVRHFAAAGGVNVAIYLGLLLLLLSFAQRARGLQFLLLCGGLVWAGPYMIDAAQPMTDVPRSCFSVAAYLFAYRYACRFQRFDLAMSALMAGAAVAGKYTELITPLLIVIALAPLMIRRRQTWAHLVPAVAVFLTVAGFWYAKNAVLFGNPIYPFVFSHPGLSDQWMADYMGVMARPSAVADRIYSNDLATALGWHDFAVVLATHFRLLLAPALLCLLGLVLPQPRRALLPAWIAALFVIWYVVMFNGARWAMPAILLLLAAAFLTWVWLFERTLALWDARYSAQSQRARNLRLALSAGVIILLGVGVASAAGGRRYSIIPLAMAPQEAASLLHRGGVNAYLGRNRAGYSLYRYIGDKNLAHVFQPFDDDASMYVTAYNDGRPNDWIVNYWLLPASLGDEDAFMAQHDIHYFIDATRISPAANARLEPRNVKFAKAMIAALKPHSTLLFRDAYGNALYKIQAVTAR